MVRPNLDKPLTPSFTVALSPPRQTPNDKAVAWDVLPWIMSVSVEDHVRKPATFSLELISREDQSGTKPWSDDERFSLGANVAVSLGYGGELDLVFAGEITALAPSFGNGAPTLTVHGEDMRHRLNTVRRIRPPFLDRKYSQIAKVICDELHVAVRETDSGAGIPYVLQANQTDLDFLQYCADQIHYELAMEGRTLLFQPVATNKASVATLTLVDDLLEFHPSIALLPLTRIVVPSWDVQKKTSMSASVGDDSAVSMGGKQSAAQQTARVFGDSPEAVPSASVGSQMELDRLASALWDTAALDYVTGGGRCRGRTDVRPGKILHITGIGQRFSGDYYVESVVHSYTGDEDYVTSFQVRRNAS